MARPIPHHIRVAGALEKIGETRNIRRIAEASGLTNQQTSRALQVARGKGLVRRVLMKGPLYGNWIHIRKRDMDKYRANETGRLSNLGRVMGDGYSPTRH